MKVAHFYWSGQKLPFYYYLSLFSFRKMNPTWEIRLYTSAEDNLQRTWDSGEQEFHYEGKDFFDDCRILADKVIDFDYAEIGFKNDLHPVHKADILRQYLMRDVGGLWSDMDILWIKPIEELYENCFSKVDITFCYHQYAFMSGVTYSSGNSNPIYHHILENIRYSYNLNNQQVLGYQTAGPSTLYELKLQETLDQSSGGIFVIPENDMLPYGVGAGLCAVNLKLSLFYPYTFKTIHDFYKEKRLPPGSTFGIHWFGGAKESADAVRTLTEEEVFSGKSEWLKTQMFQNVCKIYHR